MEEQDFYIRPLTKADWRSYKALRLEALSAHPSLFMRKHFDETARPDSSWIEEVAPEEGVVLGLFKQDTFIGMTNILVGKSEATIGMAISTGSYVDPSYRHAGLFTRLAEAMLDWTEKSNFQGVVGSHREGNIPIEKLMKAYGFRCIGKKLADWADGVQAYEVMYKKEFTPSIA